MTRGALESRQGKAKDGPGAVSGEEVRQEVL